MKRMTYFMMALALVLGLAQCKKEQPAQNETEGVFITLTLEGGNSNSRVIVDPTGNTEPAYATVEFEEGDVIYVGYKVGESNKCVGTLTYSSSTNAFSGNVEIGQVVENEYLHFYFLGGVGFTPTVNDAGTEASVVISNQTQKYPVISYSPSNEPFELTTTSYSAKLKNKCSIMKFNVTKPAESISAICITGMNNKVTVHFDTPNADDNGFSYSKDGSGQIMMKGGSGASIETWAIVLPQEALSAGGAGSAYINNYNGTRPAIEGLSENDAIGSNQYLSDATNRTITIDSQTNTGMFVGEFSVSASTKVHFSQGNLQWSGTNGWRFAPYQYVFIGGTINNTNPTASDGNYMDLFCWGATGLNGVYPNTDNTYYTGGSNLTGNNDWGACMGTGWRTLTSAEWEYLFNDRNNASNKYGLATVDGVKGLIILPDNYSGPDITPFDPVNYDSNTWDANEYDDWTAMEDLGVIFLPAAGYRSGKYFIDGMNEFGGFYWSSTGDGSGNAAGYVMFDELNFIANSMYYFGCGSGFSVRLVCNAN